MMSSFSRRDFMRGSLFAAVSWGCGRIFAAVPGAADSAGVKLKVGILSDTHIATYGAENDDEFGRAKNAKTFLRALQEFRNSDVDAVLIAGDISNDGFDSQLTAVGRAWRKVFPDDCGKDGRKVVKLFIAGNHDWEGWKYGRVGLKTYKTELEMKKHLLSEHLNEIWQKAFDEPFSEVVDKEVNGYRFIGAHWPFHNNITPYLKRAADTLPKDKPFFYFQHPPLTPPSKQTKKAAKTAESFLVSYPNAIAITGHTHYSLSDERSILYDSFTMVNAASLRYIAPPDGRENSGPMRNSDFKQMPKIDTKSSRHGLLMTVYDDRVVFARREYVENSVLAPDWVVDFSDRKRNAVKLRAKSARPPKFAPDAKVWLTDERDGADRAGGRHRQIGVVFDQAQPSSPDCGRVFDYRVEVRMSQGGLINETFAVRRFMAAGFADPQKKVPQRMECVFDAGTLPHECALEFVVQAADCFGNLSDPISTGKVRLKGKVVRW